MSADITIRAATGVDLPTAQSWLADAGLPAEDLSAAHMQDFFLAEVDDRLAGMIGIENLGSVGLLRSLVVHRDDRGSGVGTKLVAALEAHAAEAGIDALWLLTIDADRYFSRLGYEVMDRSRAPEAIRLTAEFSSLCPGDAALMRKIL